MTTVYNNSNSLVRRAFFLIMVFLAIVSGTLSAQTNGQERVREPFKTNLHDLAPSPAVSPVETYSDQFTHFYYPPGYEDWNPMGVIPVRNGLPIILLLLSMYAGLILCRNFLSSKKEDSGKQTHN